MMIDSFKYILIILIFINICHGIAKLFNVNDYLFINNSLSFWIL